MAKKLTEEQMKIIYELAENPEYQKEKRTGYYRKKYELVPNCAKIGREAGCSKTTVSYILNPMQKLKNHISKEEYYLSPEGNRKHKKFMKDYYLKNYIGIHKGIMALAFLMDELDNK